MTTTATTPEQFLNNFFTECEYNVNVRALSPDRPAVSEFVRGAGEILKFAERYKDRNVYFGCATRNGGGGKEHIREIPGLWCDVDFKTTPHEEAKRLIAGFPIPPTYAIASGGGWHLYWRLKEAAGQEDIPQVEATLRGLAKILKGDPSATDASRIMRIPGSLNHKKEYGIPRPVRVVRSSPDRLYNLGDFDLYADDPTTPQAAPPVADKIPEGARNPNLMSLAGTMRRRGMSVVSIEAALLEENKTKCTPPLSPSEVKRVAANAGKYEPAEQPGEEKKKNQATMLVEMAEGIELFHDETKTAYATIPVDGHLETHPLKAKDFRLWLSGRYFESRKTTPGAQALQDALGVLEGRALFIGEKHPVHVRVAEFEGCIYIDMGNPEWEAIRISPDGWSVVPDPPVKFRRPKSMAALPYPEPGGSIEDLRPFVTVHNESNWKLFLAWAIGAWSPKGPYPVLNLIAEMGAGKTFVARIAQSILDPACPTLRTAPDNERDLMIAAQNSWLLNFDNMSHLTPALSDSLCRISTGGGFTTREYYTTMEEAVFSAKRPIVINGISDIATRGDLLDRSIIVTLQNIPEDKRRPEKELEAAFEKALPKFLGAFLTVMSGALKDLPTTTLKAKPRMADFALWIAAAEKHLGWIPGEFATAYAGNRADVHKLALESSIISKPILQLIGLDRSWEGTAEELLEALTNRLPRDRNDNPKTPRRWPDTAQKVSGQLRRIAPHLRASGIVVDFDARQPGTGRRLITLEAATNTTEEGSTIEAPPAPTPEPPWENPMLDRDAYGNYHMKTPGAKP